MQQISSDGSEEVGLKEIKEGLLSNYSRTPGLKSKDEHRVTDSTDVEQG